eukprot:g15379.t1
MGRYSYRRFRLLLLFGIVRVRIPNPVVKSSSDASVSSSVATFFSHFSALLFAASSTSWCEVSSWGNTPRKKSLRNTDNGFEGKKHNAE